MLAGLLCLCALPIACALSEEVYQPTAEDLLGPWRGVLQSPGGELPFGIVVERLGDGLSGYVVNGSEEVPFSDVTLEDGVVRLVYAWYDSRIEAELFDGRMVGLWTKTAAEGKISSLPFEATRSLEARFLPVGESGLEPGDASVTSIAGAWDVVFADEDGSEPARGELHQDGARVSGTFLTPTGDYRFLEGSYEEGLLRLSTFDGGHAFLFHARAGADGDLVGDFWSRDTYHATWSAERGDELETPLPDAWELVGLTNDEGRFAFDFPDLDGERLRSDDPRFDGKVVLVNIFGSWCPNCNDKAPLLSEWARTYRDLGLEVVGLAYEFTGDPERDRQMVRRFGVRHRIDYPLLVAGVSDKAKAAETLPDLTSVVAYPTTVFIDRTGRVRKIHSGFSGPGTGLHYDRLIAEMTATIEALLTEPA